MFEADTNRINVVRNAAGKWADDLIDLGRTNTLLYFKDTKTSTLDLTQADPLALTRLLAGQKTHLNALIKDPSVHQAACTRARNIRKKIVAFEEEQGINVGHLARGLVRVTPPGSVSTTSPGRFQAPLLLQAVTVHTVTSQAPCRTAACRWWRPVCDHGLVRGCRIRSSRRMRSWLPGSRNCWRWWRSRPG